MTRAMIALYINEFCGLSGYVGEPPDHGFTVRYPCETKIECCALTLREILTHQETDFMVGDPDNYDKRRAEHCEIAKEMILEL